MKHKKEYRLKNELFFSNIEANKRINKLLKETVKNKGDGGNPKTYKKINRDGSFSYLTITQNSSIFDKIKYFGLVILVLILGIIIILSSSLIILFILEKWRN